MGGARAGRAGCLQLLVLWLSLLADAVLGKSVPSRDQSSQRHRFTDRTAFCTKTSCDFAILI